MEELLLYLFIGSRGGLNRAKIVNLISRKPLNTYQITETLNLNYKTVRHHLNVLEKNNVVKCNKGVRYGAVFFLTNDMKRNYDVFEKIFEKIKEDE